MIALDAKPTVVVVVVVMLLVAVMVLAGIRVVVMADTSTLHNVEAGGLLRRVRLPHLPHAV